MNININDKKYIKTYREIAKNKNSKIDFIESDDKGIDFDLIKDDFQSLLSKAGKIIHDSTLKSCDGLIIEEEKFILIEFKDSKIDGKLNRDINKKIIHSCFILEKLNKSHIFDMNIEFICVYSDVKNTIDNSKAKKHLSKLANKNILFNLVDTMNLMINNVKSMNEKEFLNYLKD